MIRSRPSLRLSWGQFLGDLVGLGCVKPCHSQSVSGLQNRLRSGGGKKAKDAKKVEHVLLAQLFIVSWKNSLSRMR